MGEKGEKVVTFGTVNEFEDDHQTPAQEHIHLRIQQRNGRKCITLIEGFPQDIDLKKVLRYFKKNFQCNGTIVTDEEENKVMQLTGDRRKQVAKFLEEEQIVPRDSIKMHGS
jgi:translation initiation factor 1